MRLWSTHALRRTLSRAGSSGANDHPPAPRPQAGGRLPQAPPLRRGLGTPYGNDRGAWTRGGGSAYTPPGLVVSCGVGISVVSVIDVFLALLWPRKCSRSSFSRRPDDAYPSRRSASAARPQRRLGRPPLPPGRAHVSYRWYCGRESYSPTLFIIQLCTSRSSPAPRRRVLESHFEQMRGIEPGATRTDL